MGKYDQSHELKKAYFKRPLGIAEHKEYLLLMTALRRIQKSGFDAMTFTQLAKDCGISRPLLHRYFSSKNQIAEKLLELTTLDLKIFVHHHHELGPAPGLKSYCRATLDWMVTHRMSAATLFSLLELTSRVSVAAKKNASLSLTGQQRIRTLLAEANVMGDLVYKSHAIQMLLTGCYLNLIAEDMTPAESLKLTRNCLRACLDLAQIS